VTKGEVLRRALEGDLQRLKLALTDKETECQVYQQRVDSVSHQLQDMESKAQSLQLTVDRLSSALAKVEEEETASKTKVGQGHAWVSRPQCHECDTLLLARDLFGNTY
jgi:rootletin